MKSRRGNITSSWPIIVDEQTEQQIKHQENGKKEKLNLIQYFLEEAFNNDQLLQKDRKRHSIQCLYLDENEEHIKRIDTFATNNHHQQPPPTTTNVFLFKNNLFKSESDRTEKISSSSSTRQIVENDNNNKYLNELQQNNEQNISLNQQKQQIEKLQRKCSRLEQLDSAYRKIKRDYEQMLENEELSLISFYKLEHQFRLLDIENEQIRFEFITNIGQNALFEEEKSFEEKIKVLENLTFNAQRQAKAAKERVHSFIFSQQQSSSSSSSVFGSILAASRIIGGELQKVGKIKAQEFLPVGTEELFNKFNKELDSFLIGTTEKPEKSHQNENQLNEDLIFDKLNAGKTASKIVDFLDIRRSFNLFSNDFDQWSMSGTTTRGDQNKEMSLPTNMSDENREQLISLLGDEEERLDGGEDNFSGSKGEVRVLRQKIVQKRKIKRRQFIQRKSLVNEGTSQLFTFDLMSDKNEEFNLTKPISEEREQKIMKILNKIVHNEEENKEEEELEIDKTEQIEKKKIKKEEENLIFEQNIFNNEEENVKEKMSSSLFEWTIEENDGEENVICDENFEKKLIEEMEHFQETIAIPSIELSGLLGEIEISQPEESSLKMSSTTSSHSSTLSTTIKKPTNPSILFKLIFKISDSSNWILLNIPFKIGHVGHCRHFLTICPKKKAFRPYYLMNNSLKSIQGKRCTPQWKQLRLHADGISIKDDGTRLWRIWNSAGFAPISKLDFIWPCSIFSKNSQWYQMTSRNEGNLLSVVLTSRHAWYLTDRGVFVQMFLPDSAAGIGYWYRTQENDEIDKFVQITASDDAVWVLNNFGMIAARVGLRRCPMGIDWAYLDSQPKKFVSISIYDKIGFGLDVQGVLWLIQGVALESPFGVGNWINCSPLQMNSMLKIAPAPIAEWRLNVGSIGIFINIGTALLYLPEPFNEKEDNKEILLSRAREMPERTLSGSSASSWCKLDG